MCLQIPWGLSASSSPSALLFEGYACPSIHVSNVFCLPLSAHTQVQLSHLIQHQGLDMHYVFGFPLSVPLPNALGLLDGSQVCGWSFCARARPQK